MKNDLGFHIGRVLRNLAWAAWLCILALIVGLVAAVLTQALVDLLVGLLGWVVHNAFLPICGYESNTGALIINNCVLRLGN